MDELLIILGITAVVLVVLGISMGGITQLLTWLDLNADTEAPTHENMKEFLKNE